MSRGLSGKYLSLCAVALFAAISILSSCSGLSFNREGSGAGGGGGAKAVPSIVWPTPAPITDPTPLSSTQLDATASVAGSFVYNPPVGTVLAAGTQVLSVTFTPGNTTAYTAAEASVSITVNPAPPPVTTDAYIYVSSSSSSSNTTQVYAYREASDGTFSLIAGSPFTTTGAVEATNGKYLFGSDGIDIDSYSVASGGALQQVASINAQQFNGKNLNGGACGGPTALFFDQTGSVLYDLDFYSDCANNGYQFFGVDSSSGALSNIGITAATTPIFDVPLSFLGNNQFAYGASCYHLYQAIFGFARGSDGSLTSLGFAPGLNPPMPAAPTGQIYCPYLTATDSANHVAVAVQLLDNASLQPVNPFQVAVYTADNSGNLTTTSTYSNMPTVSITTNAGNSLNALSMSPSGQLLAVAGTAGLQVFHFNGANAITTYTTALTTDPVDRISWDNDNHLYAISQSQGRLYVFNVTSSSNGEASGSPYTVASPINLVALPQ